MIGKCVHCKENTIDINTYNLPREVTICHSCAEKEIDMVFISLPYSFNHGYYDFIENIKTTIESMQIYDQIILTKCEIKLKDYYLLPEFKGF